MNIRQAAAQIESAARAYAAKTPEGRYRIALAAQRPIYLIGPPGVGKTAAVEQAARRLGFGYAAYTMTHHTRQSAIGLPVIARRRIDGQERAVTEYTMSEIVAAVWAQAEAGAEQGILFLDEINCVSESLMPAMLQLLQYKTFGVHALPRGWMIVCAGNPPKYNRYAHTFDAVVLDRLRVIVVEPDLPAWRDFAAEHGVHPSVRSWLALRPEDFYAADGDSIVTARSWTDLSDMMLAMEAEGDAADEALFGQYLQIPAVAEGFGLYHRLCAGRQARLDGVLTGAEGPSLAGAPFEESLFAAMLLAGRLEGMAAEYALSRRRGERMAHFAEGVAIEAKQPTHTGAAEACRQAIERLERALEARERSGALSEADRAAERWALSRMRAAEAEARSAADDDSALAALRRFALAEAAPAEAQAEALKLAVSRAFDFMEGHVPDPNVRLIFLNDLRGHGCAREFIHAHAQARFDALWRRSDPEERSKNRRN